MSLLQLHRARQQIRRACPIMILAEDLRASDPEDAQLITEIRVMKHHGAQLFCLSMAGLACTVSGNSKCATPSAAHWSCRMKKSSVCFCADCCC
eukprot:6176627-Pleurochrysis_carterae.AAC.3